MSSSEYRIGLSQKIFLLPKVFFHLIIQHSGRLRQWQRIFLQARQLPLLLQFFRLLQDYPRRGPIFVALK